MSERNRTAHDTPVKPDAAPSTPPATPADGARFKPPLPRLGGRGPSPAERVEAEGVVLRKMAKSQRQVRARRRPIVWLRSNGESLTR
jgi:hypothetical protein